MLMFSIQAGNHAVFGRHISIVLELLDHSKEHRADYHDGRDNEDRRHTRGSRRDAGLAGSTLNSRTSSTIAIHRGSNN